MQRLNSSLRTTPPEITLARAKALGARLGVSRVTDTTRLDSVGIPVFASIRPGAVEGSLCVNAGKGVRPIEAEVGAHMEAIEFAVAEPKEHLHTLASAGPLDVLGGVQSISALADFCPIHGKGVTLGGSLDCVPANDLVTGAEVLIPAETVFLPYTPRSGKSVFGSSSNGLASGNSIAEATLHALFEVIERDISAFNQVNDVAVRIDEETLPAVCAELIDKIEAAGLSVSVRVIPNEFGIPMFDAHVFDAAALGSVALASGLGCHAVPEIALVRAITEAAQSRLSAIHGGRDDLRRSEARLAEFQTGALETAAGMAFRALIDSRATVSFDDLDDWMPQTQTIDDAISMVSDRLLRQGIQHICRVILTSGEDELHVVRVVVPKLEFFGHGSRRVGPRLLGYLHGRIS
jgi:ribosomal protein S12 methylthiotransferase accessory factor